MATRRRGLALTWWSFRWRRTALLTAAGGALLLCRTRALLASARDAAEDRAEPLADLNAALALAQLKRYDGDMQTRRGIRDAYHASITRTRHRTLSLPPGADENLQVPFSYPVVVADGARDVQRYAGRARIDTRSAYGGSIVAEGGAAEGGAAGGGAADGGATNGAAAAVPDEAPDDAHPAGACPAADSLARRCVLFPLYPLLGDGQVEVIAKVLATLP